MDKPTLKMWTLERNSFGRYEHLNICAFFNCATIIFPEGTRTARLLAPTKRMSLRTYRVSPANERHGCCCCFNRLVRYFVQRWTFVLILFCSANNIWIFQLRTFVLICFVQQRTFLVCSAKNICFVQQRTFVLFCSGKNMAEVLVYDQSRRTDSNQWECRIPNFEVSPFASGEKERSSYIRGGNRKTNGSVAFPTLRPVSSQLYPGRE